MCVISRGFLAITYGERALALMTANGTTVSLAAVGTLAAGFAAYLLWRKARAWKGR